MELRSWLGSTRRRFDLAGGNTEHLRDGIHYQPQNNPSNVHNHNAGLLCPLGSGPDLDAIERFHHVSVETAVSAKQLFGVDRERGIVADKLDQILEECPFTGSVNLGNERADTDQLALAPWLC